MRNRWSISSLWRNRDDREWYVRADEFRSIYMGQYSSDFIEIVRKIRYLDEEHEVVVERVNELFDEITDSILKISDVPHAQELMDSMLAAKEIFLLAVEEVDQNARDLILDECRIVLCDAGIPLSEIGKLIDTESRFVFRFAKAAFSVFGVESAKQKRIVIHRFFMRRSTVNKNEKSIGKKVKKVAIVSAFLLPPPFYVLWKFFLGAPSIFPS